MSHKFCNPTRHCDCNDGPDYIDDRAAYFAECQALIFSMLDSGDTNDIIRALSECLTMISYNEVDLDCIDPLEVLEHCVHQYGVDTGLRDDNGDVVYIDDPLDWDAEVMRSVATG